MKALTESWLVPALVCVLGAAGAVLGAPNPVDRPAEVLGHGGPPPRSYADDARALLGGLTAGDTIEGDWRVVEVYGPAEGRITVTLEHEGLRASVVVLSHGEEEHIAPLTKGPYDLYFMVPAGTEPPPGAIDSALGGIAVRIVDDAGVPEGM
ncbi:MAG: hypothetical protein DRJ42_27215 [Deltaproteobacteria bacterium]|nr:MAG: hypothetical protein DRJ42_27215 [Deltaproteobacteria bacterium]